MPFVIYISVDGLRSGDPTRDLQSLIEAGLAPNFARLQQQGAWTFDARTDPNHTNTIPNHSTMITGRPVEDASGAPGHRYRYNDDTDEFPDVPVPGVNLSTLHTSAGEYVPSFFNVAHDNGLTTALYATKSKFSLYDVSYDGEDGPMDPAFEEVSPLAQDRIGPDNGDDKIDRYFQTSNVQLMIDRLLADVAAGGLAEMTFVHIRSPDSAGHDMGWGSPEYLQAIQEADAQIGRIFALIDQNAAYAGNTFLFVTADHGGGGDEPVTDTNHASPNSPLNFTIPFFVYGPDVPAGTDLYALNPQRRTDPDPSLNPSILVAGTTGTNPPIRNGDGGNLALDLLGLGAIPTSAINARLDLNVFDVVMRYGTTGADTLAGDDGRNGLDGDAGDDILSAGAGNDVIDGGEGDDRIDGGTGDDRLNGGPDNDTASYASAPAGVTVTLGTDRKQDTGGAGLDTLVAVENLEGSAFADRLTGNAADNLLAGGEGNDVLLLGDGGADSASGGAGKDVIFYGTALGADDRNNGGADMDTLVLQGNVDLTFGPETLVEIEGVSVQSGSVTRWGGDGLGSFDYTLRTIDANVAAGQQMRVNGQSLRAGEDFTFDGSAETDGSFFVIGGFGIDSLTGGAGNDLFQFEAGRFGAGDRVNGGAGRDSVIINAGEATGTEAFAVLIGAGVVSNVESLSFNPRFSSDMDARPSYSVVLEAGNVAPGAALIVNANSLAADQRLDFDGSAEQAGRLLLIGGGGDDGLHGGQGADTMEGGAGADRLSGEGGADLFRFRQASDSAPDAPDQLLDFGSDDLIDLSPLDGTLQYIGDAAFSGAAGQLRAAAQDDGRWLVEADLDGNGSADFALLVSPAEALTTGDFLL